MTTTQKITRYFLATVLLAVLLGSALAAPTFSAYADKGSDKSKTSTPTNNSPPKADPPKSNDPPKSDPPKSNDP
ncbi:MAG TPA: hypothetical protein VFG24_06820, partial [Nitrosopumilaceae archaeon]|nr:hypothetical protein [Nitrosopumilaceae archaeon]